MSSLARDRKRKAVSELRDLAAELGVPTDRKLPDLTAVAFTAAHAQVVAACRTDQQRQRAAALAAAWKGEGAPSLPPVAGRGGQQPQGQGLAPGAPDQLPQEEHPEAFRLRSSSCLFTWNSHALNLIIMVRPLFHMLCLRSDFEQPLDFLGKAFSLFNHIKADSLQRWLWTLCGAPSWPSWGHWPL